MISAFVLVSVGTASEKKVLEAIRNIEEVSFAHELYGEWDLIAKIEVSDIRDLDGVISKKIREIPEVKLTSTMVVAG